FRRYFELRRDRAVYKEQPDNWFISARQWSRSADIEEQEHTLSGLHADYIFFMVDEVGGVPEAVLAAAEGALATGIECHLVVAGNPTHCDGPLWRACRQDRDLWTLIEVTGDPSDPKRAPRVDRDWAIHQIQKYGRRSPFVLVNVFGKFPVTSSEALVSVEDVLNAFDRNFAYLETPLGYRRDSRGNALERGTRVAGLDVSRRGSALNVFTVRDGDYVLEPISWQGQDHVWTAGRAVDLMRELDVERLYVDDVGYGGGVTDLLVRQGVQVVPVNVGIPAADDEHYVNLRAEFAGRLQERFRTGRISLDPSFRDTEFVTEATTLSVDFDKRNRKIVEDKDRYRQRVGRSPDFWDSLALTMYEEVQPPGQGACGEERELFRGRNYVAIHRGGEVRVVPRGTEDEDDPAVNEWVPRRRAMRLRA
ncbi:MAG TPA: hypothetical protein VD788_13315, partial [Candidatus Polarisedimenticolaceae bacterium]|nr:hypothetical protein [Candidatus Polarisedimenticolaceae bacterium]